MKHLGVLLLPGLDGMLVHCRVDIFLVVLQSDFCIWAKTLSNDFIQEIIRFVLVQN